MWTGRAKPDRKGAHRETQPLSPELTLEKKYDGVTQACHRAVEDLRLAKIRQRTDALTTVLVARTATDKKVTITVTKSSDTLAQVKIRVGVFGDESLALAILDKIKSFL